ncbi:MAG: hypothetical protein U0235_31680 [Polyangiaceae bacterium]
MSRIDGTTAATRTGLEAGGARLANIGEPPSLLPAPAAEPNASEAMAGLYTLLVARREAGSASAEQSLHARQTEEKAALARELDALSRARAHEANEGRGFFDSIGHIVGTAIDDVVHLRPGPALDHLRENLSEANASPRFWADLEKIATRVAQIAAIVGSAAATVATLGATGPLVVAVCIGVALSAASVAQDELHVLEKLGMSETAAQWTSFGAGLAGSITLGGVAATTSLAGGQIANLAKAARVVTVTSNVLGGGAKVTEAAAHVMVQDNAADAQDAMADRQKEANLRARLERSIVALVEEAKERSERVTRATDSLTGAMATHDQTMVLATTRG